jgi:Sulfatase-modifying factor enzyme 1
MKRREFLGALDGTGVAWPLSARAQQPTERMRGRVSVAGLILPCLMGLGFIGPEAIAQDVVSRYRWRMAMDPTALTVEQEKAKAASPGSDFRECASGCPVMIVIPAGKFIMGSPENEPDREASEGPRHEVTVAKPFAVSKFEVTFEEWDACAAAAACPRVKRLPLDRSSRTRWGFTTCTATSGSGSRIAGTTTTTMRQQTDQRGSGVAIKASVSSAAVPGATSQPARSGQPSAPNAMPMSGSTLSASG